MKLHFKSFSTPRAMLKPIVLRGVVDFVNQCEFSMKLNGDLNRSELGWLKFIESRVVCMIETCPDFGGDMQKILIGYKKLLPQIQKLLQYDPV